MLFLLLLVVQKPLKVSMEGKTHKQTIMGSCCDNVNGGKKIEGLDSDSDSSILELQSTSRYLKFNYMVGATLSRKENQRGIQNSIYILWHSTICNKFAFLKLAG